MGNLSNIELPFFKEFHAFCQAHRADIICYGSVDKRFKLAVKLRTAHGKMAADGIYAYIRLGNVRDDIVF